MNEVLSSIRMIKSLAFEQPFEERIMASRTEELKQLRRNFLLEVAFNAIWSVSPILCVLVSFYVYTSVMGQELTPSIAFASLAVWNELRFALNAIPEILVNVGAEIRLGTMGPLTSLLPQAIQCLVSLRRIDSYLHTPDVDLIPSSASRAASSAPQKQVVPAFVSATVTWPRKAEDGTLSDGAPSGASTPGPRGFELQDIDARFPEGKMSLICGSLGSGKTLMLLGE